MSWSHSPPLPAVSHSCSNVPASYLALVCIIKAENFERKGLLDTNISIFKSALTEVFDMSKKSAFAAAARVAKPAVASSQAASVGKVSTSPSIPVPARGKPAASAAGASEMFAASYSSSYNGEG